MCSFDGESIFLNQNSRLLWNITVFFLSGDYYLNEIKLYFEMEGSAAVYGLVTNDFFFLRSLLR